MLNCIMSLNFDNSSKDSKYKEAITGKYILQKYWHKYFYEWIKEGKLLFKIINYKIKKLVYYKILN